MKDQVLRPEKIIEFVNNTDEDFVGVLEKRPYTFKKGYAYQLSEDKAYFFAKHLAIRENNKEVLKGGKVESLLSIGAIERKMRSFMDYGDVMEGATTIDSQIKTAVARKVESKAVVSEEKSKEPAAEEPKVPRRQMKRKK